MALGFVLVGTEPAKEHEVYEKLVKLPMVTEAFPVFGEYDIVAKVEGEDYKDISVLVSEKIRGINGVKETKVLTGIKW